METHASTRIVPSALTICIGLACTPALRAEQSIIRQGQAYAEIVLAGERPRMVGLAALELQYCLQKITGARLPIAAQPGDELPLKVYVGRSEHTDRLGITGHGLKYGGFGIVSGPDRHRLCPRHKERPRLGIDTH